MYPAPRALRSASREARVLPGPSRPRRDLGHRRDRGGSGRAGMPPVPRMLHPPDDPYPGRGAVATQMRPAEANPERLVRRLLYAPDWPVERELTLGSGALSSAL